MNGFATAVELRTGYQLREISPVEIVAQLAEQIVAAQPAYNALAALRLEEAIDDARDSERRFIARDARPLEGIPMVVKDLFDTAGLTTTYGSSMFETHVPRANARAVQRALDAGALLLAKSRTDEFAFGITNVNPHYGPARNPWATDRVSGGSSGGSAVALAAGLAPLALGSDTGGSIRLPSAFCGVVGFKPSYGVVSCRGMWAMARQFDHAGPMARTPQDTALLLAAVAEQQPWLARDDRGRLDLAGVLHIDPKGLRVGSCPDLELVPLDPTVRDALESTLRIFEQLGCTVDIVGAPEPGRLFETHATIRDAETLHTHRLAGLFPERRGEYGPLLDERLERASRVDLVAYLTALDTRAWLCEEYEGLFDDVDVLILPVTAAGPLPIETPDVDDRVFEKAGPLAVPQNLLGLPACALRAGFDSDGLPVGIQLVGRFGADLTVLRAAQALWAATPELQARWPGTACL